MTVVAVSGALIVFTIYPRYTIYIPEHKTAKLDMYTIEDMDIEGIWTNLPLKF